jgi:hypothetical protein
VDQEEVLAQCRLPCIDRQMVLDRQMDPEVLDRKIVGLSKSASLEDKGLVSSN